MPQLFINIKAQQRIDDYGSLNDIMNLTLTISRQSKMTSIKSRVNIPVGVVVADVVGQADVVLKVEDGTAVGGVGQCTEYKYKFK
jgi:hypothetical protein